MKTPRRKPDDVVNGYIRIWYLELIVADQDGGHKAKIVDGEIVYGTDMHGNWKYGFSPIVSERYRLWLNRYERHLNHLILS